MSILLYCEPLGSLIPYDPSLKVEDCLDDPLCLGLIDENGIALSILSIVSQLDLLCKKELLQQKTAKIEHGQFSNSFESKAMVLRRNITVYFEKLLQQKLSLLDFLYQIGADQLYPRAVAYLRSPNNAVFPETATEMDGYFSSIAQLHQLLSLCQQMQEDITVLDNHKYIAHQLAVLFQLLNNIGTYEPLTMIKENIEEIFQNIKESIKVTPENTQPVLRNEYRVWLLDLTNSICDIVCSFPVELTEAWHSPASVASSLLK